jgi:ABC-type proline/glycine betaine transport system substrate-binding protein
MPAWHADLDTAKAVAQSSGRPILLYTWSPG